MKNYDGTYLASNRVLSVWNNWIDFQNENIDEITCAEFEKTVYYIFSRETYEEQIQLYINQLREGWNSIDYLFTDDLETTGLDMHNSDTETLVKAISNEIDVEDFQTRIIEECKEYMENSIEEEDY